LQRRLKMFGSDKDENMKAINDTRKGGNDTEIT
jgi:hypothetical protein